MWRQVSPGHYNDEGKLNKPNGFFSVAYGGGKVMFFFDTVENWRATGRRRTSVRLAFIPDLAHG